MKRKNEAARKIAEAKAKKARLEAKKFLESKRVFDASATEKKIKELYKDGIQANGDNTLDVIRRRKARAMADDVNNPEKIELELKKRNKITSAEYGTAFVKNQVWTPITDEITGAIYWWNQDTDQVSWKELLPGEKVKDQKVIISNLLPWVKVKDPVTLKYYYWNAETNAMSWKTPPKTNHKTNTTSESHEYKDASSEKIKKKSIKEVDSLPLHSGSSEDKKNIESQVTSTISSSNNTRISTSSTMDSHHNQITKEVKPTNTVSIQITNLIKKPTSINRSAKDKDSGKISFNFKSISNKKKRPNVGTFQF